MKQLIQPIYYESIEIRTKNGNETLKQHKINCNTIYSELPETEIKILKNFDDIPHYIYSGFKRKYKGKKYFIYNFEENTSLWNNYHIDVWEDDFIKKIQRMEYKVLDEKNYTLQDLMNKLSASDMIEYMKDRGMAYCPIIK